MSTTEYDLFGRWSPLMDVEAMKTWEYFNREFSECYTLGIWPLGDAAGAGASERLRVLRKGGKGLCRQYVLRSTAEKNWWNLEFFYPILFGGITTRAYLCRLASPQSGFAPLIGCVVTSLGIPVTFFDTMFFANGPAVAPGAAADVAFAALACRVRAVEARRISVAEGALWEYERDERLASGDTGELAARPVELDLAGMSLYEPLDDGEPDDAIFQGVIERVDRFDHFGVAVHRLEIPVVRLGEEEWRIPVYATERVLGGYVPEPGDTVAGTMWLQGRIVGVGA